MNVHIKFTTFHFTISAALNKLAIIRLGAVTHLQALTEIPNDRISQQVSRSIALCCLMLWWSDTVRAGHDTMCFYFSSAVCCSVQLYGIVHCSVVQCCIVLYYAVQCSAVPNSVVLIASTLFCFIFDSILFTLLRISTLTDMLLPHKTDGLRTLTFCNIFSLFILRI
jgi:hypothetical protein